MDVFGCYDYKRPASTKDSDMRTSYYRAHRYLTDQRLGDKFNAKIADRGIYVSDPLLHEKQNTEYTGNYEWKYCDPNAQRNPAMSMKMQFMKSFEQTQLRFIKRKMKPMSSVTKEAFTWQPEEREPMPTPVIMPTPVKVAKFINDPSKMSYNKYLDPAATTYKLSYVRYHPTDIQAGVAAQDNLTFWNWAEHKPDPKRPSHDSDLQMCNEGASKFCQKRGGKIQSMVKPVPNAGLITEVRENFLDPKYRKDYMEYHTTDVLPIFLSDEVLPMAAKGESGIIGSGDPVVKFV